VRLSVALHGAVHGATAAVPVGTPNERVAGEAETVCASKFWGARPSTTRIRTTKAIRRKFVSKAFTVHSLELGDPKLDIDRLRVTSVQSQ